MNLLEKKSLIIFVLILFYTCNTYAYIAHSLKATKRVYCPEKIECTENQGCILKGENAVQYWKPVSTGGSVPGNYAFNSVYVNFVKGGIITAQCIYQYTDNYPFPVPGIFVNYNEQDDIEPIKEDKSPYWIITNNGANCKANSATLCPFQDKSSLLINQNILTKDGYPSNKFARLHYAINGVLYEHDINAPYLIFTYEDALKYCGSVKKCTIYIKEQNGFDYGSVDIDLSNNLQVLNITQAKLNFPYTILKHTNFNKIEFMFK